MAENKFFDKINLEHYHRYVSGMIKRLSDNIDERIDEKFKNFIEDNVSDGEILDSRGGERTLGDRLNKFDEKYSEVSSQLAHIPKGFEDSTLLTMKDRYESMYINVKDFGAKGDGVTDDSLAIKKAINYMCSKAIYENSNNGWKTCLPTLYFPNGRYVVSENGTLNCNGVALKGYNIKGAGYHSSEILFTGDDYLLVNGDDNWFGFSYIEDLAIRGNGSNNFWKIKSRAGSPQANRFRRVCFFNLNNCVTVSYGSANHNADLFRFDSCKASNINGWVFGIDSNMNSQSLVHSFHDCDFESINGYILYLKSGGIIEVRGGSWILNREGRAFHFDDLSGVGIGFSNRIVNVYATKFEYQYYDNTDTNDSYYPLFYNNSRMELNFKNCNFNQFKYTSIGDSSYYGYLGEIGFVKFDECSIPDIFKIKINNNLSQREESARSTVVFDGCTLNKSLDSLVYIVNKNDYQGGNYPHVICKNTRSEKNIDTQLFKEFGKRATSTNKKLITYTQNENFITSLPAKKSADLDDVIKTFKLPIGAIITDIRIYFTKIGDGSSHTIDVTDNNDNILITGSHIGTNPDIVFSTDNLFKLVRTENDRILKVVGKGVNVNGGIGGFIAVEYY